MEIVFVRHGKTQGNLEGRYVGRTDEPLLDAAKEELEHSPYREFLPELVYCSPMLRCRQTAEILFADQGVEQLVWQGLEETDFGAFEYKNYQELNGHPAYQAWIDSGGQLAFPEGESGTEFRARCRRAFQECLADARKRQLKRIAFVVHGGTIMSVMEAFAEPKRDFYSWQVKNGEGFHTRLMEEEKRWYLENL